MFGWIFRNRAKREQFRQSDRSERNAVIRRIVTAAAKTTPKTDNRVMGGDVAGPFVVHAAEAVSTASGNIPRDRIAERAYEIWVRNGRPTGTADNDWIQAARELSTEIPRDPVPQ